MRWSGGLGGGKKHTGQGSQQKDNTYVHCFAPKDTLSLFLKIESLSYL